MSAVRIAVVLVSLLSYASADDNSPARSHRTVVFGLCDSVVHHYITDHGRETAAAVSLLFSPDTFTATLRPLFIQSFVTRGVNVAEKPAEGRTIVEVLVTEASVAFGDVFTESFFGTRRSERTVRLSVSIMTRTADAIVRAVPVTVMAVDTVNYAEIESLSDSGMPLTSVRTPSLTVWDTLLEPAIITMASAVAIYLFFTIRS